MSGAKPVHEQAHRAAPDTSQLPPTGRACRDLPYESLCGSWCRYFPAGLRFRPKQIGLPEISIIACPCVTPERQTVRIPAKAIARGHFKRKRQRFLRFGDAEILQKSSRVERPEVVFVVAVLHHLLCQPPYVIVIAPLMQSCFCAHKSPFQYRRGLEQSKNVLRSLPFALALVFCSLGRPF